MRGASNPDGRTAALGLLRFARNDGERRTKGRQRAAPPSGGRPAAAAARALRRLVGEFVLGRGIGIDLRQRVHHTFGREDDDHFGSDAQRRIETEFPAVQLDQALDDRQPEACPFFCILLRERPAAEISPTTSSPAASRA